MDYKTMLTSNLIQNLTHTLERMNLASAQAEARMLLEWITQKPYSLLQFEPNLSLSSSQQVQLDLALERRKTGEPLQLIMGVAHFYGLELEVCAGVLIPRPETEVLVWESLARLRGQAGKKKMEIRGQVSSKVIDPPRVTQSLNEQRTTNNEQQTVLDLCTGSGAIALALKSESPNLEVWGSDLDDLALELAGRNSYTLGLQIHWQKSDLLDQITGKFSAIVCNPPYLPLADRQNRPPELEHEPDRALYSGTDGLELARRLLEQTEDFLERGGFLALELDPRNVRVLEILALERGWHSQVVGDLVGRERFLFLNRDTKTNSWG